MTEPEKHPERRPEERPEPIDKDLLCLRCGDRHLASEFAIAELPVCLGCVERATAPWDRVAIFPPREVLFLRLRFMGTWCAGAFVLFAIIVGGAMLAFASPPEAILVGLLSGLGAGLLTLVGVSLVGFSKIQHLGNERWKEIVRDELGLQPLPKDGPVSMGFALALTRRPRLTNLKLPMEIGLLLKSRSGLLFVNADGSRIAAIPIETIRSGGPEAVAAQMLALPAAGRHACVRARVRLGLGLGLGLG